jgi:hypothetical protein
MNRLKRVSTLALAFTIMTTGYCIINKRTYAQGIDQDLNTKLMESINDNAKSNPMLNFSSNPYDYIKNNSYYKKIIELGYDALPSLEENLKKSTSSGLLDYIKCAAIEQITNCNLKQFKDFKWDTASNFKTKWDEYFKEIPMRVNAILNSNKSNNEKINEITKLGAPAVPYVIENSNKLKNTKCINVQQESIAGALSKMLNSTKPAATIEEFINNNNTSIQKIKDYVQKHQ